MYFDRRPAMVKVLGTSVRFTTRKTVAPGSTTIGAARHFSDVIVTRTRVWRCACLPDEANPARRSTLAARIAQALTPTFYPRGTLT
jgi:hypothetical protein